MALQCGGFVFTADFDSGNLAKVELVSKQDEKVGDTSSEGVEYEFNVWPKADCAGTEFENGNRTWFHFGMKGGTALKIVKINIVNLNRQVKMFSQGMAPVFKSYSTRNQWERIREKPTYNYDGTIFTLSFKHRIGDTKSFTYFAFTYPYSYSELQTYLLNIDNKISQLESGSSSPDEVYYHRECVCYTLEGRRVDLLTISSHHNISDTPEPRLPHLFPEDTCCRPKKFVEKKVIFLSARVHPGETPSSFVMNGAINFLLTPDDPIAQLLRKLYVFKIIPMLNPDGVARGHYRTDTRGVNLNRYYTNPSHVYHPSVYAARSLILYHHYGTEEIFDTLLPEIETKVSDLSITKLPLGEDKRVSPELSPPALDASPPDVVKPTMKEPDKSGLFLYMDFHGHASKKGIFMYGNHFRDISDKVECMLLPKIMSINSPHFHFHACNFTERIMYLRDRRDGLSREGAGRVTVGKITGLVRSYTLECNYNTGRIVNVVPPYNRDSIKRNNLALVPPRYTPAIFEEVGKTLGVSILDMTNANPFSRIVNSEYHSLSGLRDWLKKVIVHDANSAVYKMKTRKNSDTSQVKRKTKSDTTTESSSLIKTADRKENLIAIPKVTATTKPMKKKIKKSANGNVLQVRAKCVAVNNVACCSKSLTLPAKATPLAKKFSTKDVENLVIKKGPKRIKISTECESKWSKPTTSQSDDASIPVPSWKSLARLEKKTLDPTRRKKLKSKPK